MNGLRIFLVSLLFLIVVAPVSAATVEIRALLVPIQQATISSRIEGRITSLPVEEGDQFNKDAVLVEFDCAILKAELEKARMDLEAATETHEAQLQLQKYGSSSVLEVAVASAKRKRATAEVHVMETKVGMCSISAPFAGRVVKREAHPYENVRPDDPLLEILDDSRLKVHTLVPSHWSVWLQKGLEFGLRVDETGKSYKATITLLGAKVNPVNQTLDVEAIINGVHPELLAGMSGTALFSPPSSGGKR